MHDEQVYEYFGIEATEFKDMKKQVRHREKEERKQKMVQGEIPPTDKNFFELKTDDIVTIQVSLRTPILKGRVRMAFANDSYVIETENGLVSWEMMVPGRKITSTKPYIFEIGMPNHHKVFRTEKDLDMATVDFLTTYSEKYHIPIATLIGQIKTILEKYPEEFI